jgi:Domain of unknown function DUF1828
MRCEEAISKYIETLKSDFECVPAPNGRLRIVTPYIYPDHDRIEVFVREKDDRRVVVSDLGETLRHLDTLGMEVVANQKRWFQVQHITEGLQVKVREGIIFKEGPAESVGDLIFDVLAACKAVGDLIYGTKAYEPATFEDEVAEFLKEHNIETTRNLSITGQSGSKYKVSMKTVVNRTETLVAAVSPMSKAGIRQHVNSVFRMWSDVNHGARKMSLLNDLEFEFRTEDVTLLSRVCITQRWSGREAFLESLRGRQ